MGSWPCSCKRTAPLPDRDFLVLIRGGNSAGYLVSSVFICLQYLRLGIAYRRVHRILFFSFWIKLIFILVELALAVAFGVYLRRGGRQNLAAVLEWGMPCPFPDYLSSGQLSDAVCSDCIYIHILYPLLRH